MKRTLLLTLSITATLLTAAKLPPPPPTGPIVFKMGSGWKIEYSPGVGSKPRYSSAGWSFNFPTDPGHVGYITQDVTGFAPVSTTTTATVLQAVITIDASPDCIFDYHTNPDNTGNWPSSARFYIESEWSNANYVRWWATGVNCLILEDGRFQYTVPMEPQYWSDTWGQNGASSAEATAGWYKAMGAPIRVGLTYGGGSFYGHGVWLLDGAATWLTESFQFITTLR